MVFATNRSGKLAGHGVEHKFAQMADILLVFQTFIHMMP
jgi:hypothetical protein